MATDDGGQHKAPPQSGTDDLRNHARAQLAAKKKQDPRMPKLEPIPLDELLSIPGLEQFANVDGESGVLEYRTPLEQLANQNKSSVGEDLRLQIEIFFKWLVQHGADPNAHHGQALLLAIGSGYCSGVSTLLEARADLSIAQLGWNAKQQGGVPSKINVGSRELEKLLEQ